MAGFADSVKLFWRRTRPERGGSNANTGSVRPAGRGAGGARWADQTADPVEEKQSAAKFPRSSRRSQKPFVTPYYIWGTLAILAAGFAAGTLYWQARQKALEDAAARPVYEDPLIQLDEGAKTALLRSSPELAAQLKRSFLGKPDQLCAELHALGLENPGWVKAPFQKSRWQCASDLVPLTTPSVDFGSTTLFFLLRGPAEDKIDYLRLKLVVEDVRQKEIGLEAVWLVIDALASRYGWTVPEEFRQAISGFKSLDTTHRGVQLSVTPEDPNLTGDPLASQRLNIILNFGEPDLIRPADRFEVAPPLESGWSTKDPDDREGE